MTKSDAMQGVLPVLQPAHHPDELIVRGSIGFSLEPETERAAYCAAKAGLHSLAQSMALELADQGIRVNEIAPGHVNGGLSGRVFQRNPELAETSRQAVPVRELITCGEVAGAVVFLADPANQNLTGSTFILDGGLSLMHVPQRIVIPNPAGADAAGGVAGKGSR